MLVNTSVATSYLKASNIFHFYQCLIFSFLLNLVFLGAAVLYADFEAADKNDAETKAVLTYASIGIVMIQFIGIVIHPRFKEYILDKYCIRDPTEEPEPEPVVDHHRGSHTQHCRTTKG